MDLPTRLESNAGTWSWADDRTFAVGNTSLEIVNNCHAASYMAFFLWVHEAEAGAGVGDQLLVVLEHRFVVGTAWFEIGQFTTVLGNAAVNRYELYQCTQEDHGNGAVVTHANLTDAVGAGQNNFGTGAGDWFPAGDMRPIVAVLGTKTFDVSLVFMFAGY